MPRVESLRRVLSRLGVAFIVGAVLAAGGHGQGARGDVPLTLHLGQSRMLRLDAPVTSVFVADPATADVQVVASQVLFVFGKAVGRTSLAALGSDGAFVARWTVTVTLDLEPVRSALAEEPDFRDLKVRPWRQGVEVSGVVASAEAADRALQLVKAALPEKETSVVNRLSVSSSQQVNLEVQIAEVQRTVSESLGINWEAFSTRADGYFGFRVGRLIVGDALQGAVLPEGQAATLGGSVQGSDTSVRGLIDALATAGLATVLARPNMTAVSGQTASFFSGGEYPLPSGFRDGQVSFEYKKYGVLLDFVPTVIDSRRISLRVRPEVSQRVGTDSLRILDAEIPVIDVRRAETTIEVGDGESIVIAGLYRNQSDSTEAGVPALKEVPTLGALFGQRTSRWNSTELIVVVTARLIASTRVRAENRQKRKSGLRVKGYHY
ncbi:MAG: pilus assembly protein N-terminal domain-containing protein [Deltaproteobacteria bacterium]|nr:pilus assembly protein N-terminal domain-containing protein [Deltaproteobacteria bacterium]